MKEAPKVNDVIAADERFVHGFKFQSGDPDEPVQVGTTYPSDNSYDETRKNAKFRVVRVSPEVQEKLFAVVGLKIWAIRLNDDDTDNPDGERIYIYANSPEEINIVGRMRLVYEPKSDWPEPKPVSRPPLLHRCC